MKRFWLLLLLAFSIATNVWLAMVAAQRYASLEAGVAQEAVLVAELRDLKELLEASGIQKTKVLEVMQKAPPHSGDDRYIEESSPDRIDVSSLRFFFGADGALKKIESSALNNK